MKEEIEIYVGCNEQGEIQNYSIALGGIVFMHYQHRVRPITVYSTDGIIGKHYQDVDLFHRRLRECTVYSGSSYLRYQPLFNRYDIVEGSYEHNSFGTSHDSFPEALKSLVTLEGEE